MGWTNRENLVRLLARHVVGEGGAILLAGSGQLNAGHDGDGRVEYWQAGCQLRKVSIKARAYLGAVGRKSGAVEPRDRVGRGVGTNGGKGTRVGASKKGETTKIWPWRRRRGAQDASEGDGNRVGRGRGGCRVGGTSVANSRVDGGWGGWDGEDVQPRAGLSVCCCCCGVGRAKGKCSVADGRGEKREKTGDQRLGASVAGWECARKSASRVWSAISRWPR